MSEMSLQSMPVRLARVAIAATAGVLLVACGSGSNTVQNSSPTSSVGPAGSSAPASSAPQSAVPRSSAPSGPPGSSGSAGTATPSAQDYCRESGGAVQTRTPYWGTNGDQADWLALAGAAMMCRFQATDEAGSRIYVDLSTLSSPSPTLAALAYLSRTPMRATTGGANPASLYCQDLGGSSSFGPGGAAGGGWVATNDPDDVVIGLCVFPDLSYIDEWGLAYHSDGTIRGTDLSKAMDYQPGGQLPPIFVAGGAVATAPPTSR